MTVTPQEALTHYIEHHEIFHDGILRLMRLIVRGGMPPVMVATLTTRLHVKKETIDKIVVAVTVMHEFATKVNMPAGVSDHLVDIVGTGGDSVNTFSVSVILTLVMTATGTRTAKRGGRGVGSKSGSTNVSEALGMDIILMPEQMAESIEAAGIGSMFMPNHHPTMEDVAPIRKELGARTVFNILGSLTSPAGASNILMGVLHPGLVGIQVRVVQQLDAKHVVVAYGKDGMDEVSLGTITLVGGLRGGVVTEHEIHPEDFGLQMASSRSLKVAGVDESKTILIEALENESSTPREIASFNTGVALYVTNIVSSISDGVRLARKAIAPGTTRAKLSELVRVTNQFKV